MKSPDCHVNPANDNRDKGVSVCVRACVHACVCMRDIEKEVGHAALCDYILCCEVLGLFKVVTVRRR
jgi:hypothetical protein